MFKIHLLPASFGDSILIEYGKDNQPSKYILIDGGPYFAFDEIMLQIKHVAPHMQELELLVVTHIDIDHIDGIIVLLNRSDPPFKIKQIWFNGWDQIVEAQRDLMGGKQGEYLSALIKQKQLEHNKSIHGKALMLDKSDNPLILDIDEDMRFTVLSPTIHALADLASEWEKVVEEVGNEQIALERLGEDTRYDYDLSDLMGEINMADLQEAREKGDKSEANGSSIAFLAECNGKRCLFAGDAHSEKLEAVIRKVIEGEGTERLKVDAWKLAHHGSRKSTLSPLMKIIDCKNMLISTDGKRYKHPDDETLAKLIKHNGPGVRFYFNFLTPHNENWKDEDLQEEFRFESFYPGADDGNGVSISL